MTSAHPRWTPARIRKATPFPKPINVTSRVEMSLYLADNGEQVLQHIARHADIIHDGRSLNKHPSGLNETRAFPHDGHWLLVPVSSLILDVLAQIGTTTEDFESTADDEPNVDDEPSLGSLNTHSQLGWAKNGSWITDGEADDSDDDGHDDREPDDEGDVDPRPRVKVFAANGDERPPPVSVVNHPDLAQWRKM